MNSPPQTVIRLKFPTHEDYLLYGATYGTQLAQIWRWHETMGNQPDPLSIRGICEVCNQLTTFTARPRKSSDGDSFAYRVSWWSSVSCELCKMSTLDRIVMRSIKDGRIYHVGHYSSFRRRLSAHFPESVSSQYGLGRAPGEIDNGVRFEDLTNLSFASGEFDTIICMEVLEHILDYHTALNEMARIMRPGGRTILTFPWLGGRFYDHRVRAELLPDGSVNHILPPEYHGDPASKEGILSFRSFGWKILDEIRAAGFSEVWAEFVFSPLHGYMTLGTPVVMATR